MTSHIATNSALSIHNALNHRCAPINPPIAPEMIHAILDAKPTLPSRFFASSAFPPDLSVSYKSALSLPDIHANAHANKSSAIKNCPNVLDCQYMRKPMTVPAYPTISDVFLPYLSLMYPVGISIVKSAIENADCRRVICVSDNPCCVKKSAMTGVTRNRLFNNCMAASL